MEKYDLVIIGGGPAGLSAGIYAARSGLKCVVLEKGVAGGQVMRSPWIENYPGFPHIEGTKLAELMVDHAKKYSEIRTGAEVLEIEPVGELFHVRTRESKFESKSIILATGAMHKMLDVPGEKEYYGKGVSYCATCDGFFFRNKRVLVIGGGNSALTDALYLKSIGCDVTLIHRREALRADKHLQDTANNKKVKMMLNTTVEEISGDGNIVSSVKLLDNVSGDSNLLPVDGVFIAVGYIPHSELAKKLCVQLDENGYVKVFEGNRTNIPFVYSAGDLSGGILQIVAAVHGGAVAALSAFEDLTDPYYARTRKLVSAVCALPESSD